MTNAELIAKIKAEIERQEKQCPLDTYEGRHKLFILGGLKTFLSTIKLEKPTSQDEDLEEEIERIVKCEKEFMNFKFKSQLIGYIARHFAQWGANHTPLPEDTVLFNKGVSEGKRLMMGEAVEGEVVKDWDNNLSVKSGVICGFKFGEKVRVIVLPKED